MLEPFGPARDNFHAAQIAYILAQVYSDPKKRRPRFEDFMYSDPITRSEQMVAEADAFFFAGRKAD